MSAEKSDIIQIIMTARRAVIIACLSAAVLVRVIGFMTDFPRDSFIETIKGSQPDFQRVTVDYIDRLNNEHVPVIFSLKHLAGQLNINYIELRHLIQFRDGYYSYYLVKKRSGGKRRIVVPYNNLKKIQRWILDEILAKENVHHCCKGFVKGGSTLNNAKAHIGKKYIRKFDLKDFFESIDVRRVYGIFREIGYSPAVSYDLASLCTIKICDEKYEAMPSFKKHWFGHLNASEYPVLAQGAPTSPALSNLICRKLDDRMEKYAIKNGLQYTRYADDMTFSGDDLTKLPKTAFVLKIVSEEGLKLNYKKTGTFGRNSRQEVTGVMVDGEKPRVPQKFKRQIYRHLHFCKKFGARQHFDHYKPGARHARQWLYGKIYYVNAIEPDEGKKMLALADGLDWGLMM